MLLGQPTHRQHRIPHRRLYDRHDLFSRKLTQLSYSRGTSIGTKSDYKFVTQNLHLKLQ